MNDRENQNQGRQGQTEQRQNSGAGSRQQEQATAGGSMREDDERCDSTRQMEQQGGTYRPEGDRGLDFESDDSGELGIGQAEQQSGREDRDGQFERSRQQEQSEPDHSRRGSQQGERDSEDEDI